MNEQIIETEVHFQASVTLFLRKKSEYKAHIANGGG